MRVQLTADAYARQQQQQAASAARAATDAASKAAAESAQSAQQLRSDLDRIASERAAREQQERSAAIQSSLASVRTNIDTAMANLQPQLASVITAELSRQQQQHQQATRPVMTPAELIAQGFAVVDTPGAAYQPPTQQQLREKFDAGEMKSPVEMLTLSLMEGNARSG